MVVKVMAIFFLRVINKKWIKRNSINQRIGLEGSKIFSKAILESWNHGGLIKKLLLAIYFYQMEILKVKEYSQDIKLI